MTNEVLKARLTDEEGSRLVAYLDTKGILTVGVGHNCKAKPVVGVIRVGDQITREVEQQLLSEDVADAVKQLDVWLPWWRDLDDARQNVLADMCFNMGILTLCKFVNALAAMKAGDYFSAAQGMRASKWAKQVGRRAKRLADNMEMGVFE